MEFHEISLDQAKTIARSLRMNPEFQQTITENLQKLTEGNAWQINLGMGPHAPVPSGPSRPTSRTAGEKIQRIRTSGSRAHAEKSALTCSVAVSVTTPSPSYRRRSRPRRGGRRRRRSGTGSAPGSRRRCRCRG